MKNILKTTALITGMIASGTLMAATDGTLGATSTGTLDISVDVEDLVRISGLSDILLTFDATGTGDVVGSSTACVYRNIASMPQATVLRVRLLFKMLPQLQQLLAIPLDGMMRLRALLSLQ